MFVYVNLATGRAVHESKTASPCKALLQVAFMTRLFVFYRQNHYYIAASRIVRIR
jgi:hypothetical protein